MVCSDYTVKDLREWVAQGEISEWTKIKHIEYVDLTGDHWPQLTQPQNLAAAILDAAEIRTVLISALRLEPATDGRRNC